MNLQKLCAKDKFGLLGEGLCAQSIKHDKIHLHERKTAHSSIVTSAMRAANYEFCHILSIEHLLRRMLYMTDQE